MQYVDVEKSIRQAAAAADTEARRRFVAYAVDRLTRLDVAGALAAEEFTPAAVEALLAICTEAMTADTATIDGRLAVINAGTLSYGSSGPEVNWVLSAIEDRQEYLRSGDAGPVTSLAIHLIDAMDYEVDGAELDDFLADPRMLAQYNVILSLLGQNEFKPG